MDKPLRSTVTLLTEGTYPHSLGGVSVWCDQLVEGMPDVDFPGGRDHGQRPGTARLEAARQRP